MVVGAVLLLIVSRDFSETRIPICLLAFDPAIVREVG